MATKKLQIVGSLISQATDADTVDGKHADEFAAASDVEDLQTLVGDTKVSEQITTAVEGSVADWEQTDVTAVDYIKNKPVEVTSEDIVEWMSEENVVTPLASSSGEVYTTNDNKILIL